MKKLLFLFLSATLLSGIACKKYEDGGTHFDAGGHLLGIWTFQQFTINGVNSMYLLDQFLHEGGAITVEKGNGWGDSPVFRAGSPYCIYAGRLELQDHRSILHFGQHTVDSFHTFNSSSIDPFALGNQKWEILELKSSEIKLRLKDETNSKEYIIVWHEYH